MNHKLRKRTLKNVWVLWHPKKGTPSSHASLVQKHLMWVRKTNINKCPNYIKWTVNSSRREITYVRSTYKQHALCRTLCWCRQVGKVFPGMINLECWTINDKKKQCTMTPCRSRILIEAWVAPTLANIGGTVMWWTAHAPQLMHLFPKKEAI